MPDKRFEYDFRVSSGHAAYRAELEQTRSEALELIRSHDAFVVYAGCPNSDGSLLLHSVSVWPAPAGSEDAAGELDDRYADGLQLLWEEGRGGGDSA